MAIGALSLNVLIGYAGQISLGHQAFVGIGAFTSRLRDQPVAARASTSGWVVAAAVGAAQAVLLGLIALAGARPLLRAGDAGVGLRGRELHLPARGLHRRWRGPGRAPPRRLHHRPDVLLLCVIALTVILLIDWRLIATKAGRAMQALRESPHVAANYGVNVRSYTLLAFAVAGFYAGIAGALFASRRTNVVAEDFTFARSRCPTWSSPSSAGCAGAAASSSSPCCTCSAGDWLPDLAREPRRQHRAGNAGYVIQALSAACWPSSRSSSNPTAWALSPRPSAGG